MSSCIDPVPLVNPKTGKRIFVSCNRCAACLESRRQMWKFRLMNELDSSSLTTHVTLTYDDDHIGDNLLDKRDLQLFFKSLRNHGVVFRYYAIGEYGTETQRKHFHVVLFVKNYQPYEFEALRSMCEFFWSNGITYFKKVYIDTLGYVLHYHIRPKVVNNKKTIQLYSKGLGSEWFDDPEISNFVLNSKSLQIQGKDKQFYTLPRYYRKKYAIEFEQIEITRKPAIFKKIESIYKKPYFECSQDELVRAYSMLKYADFKKLSNYNKQERL